MHDDSFKKNQADFPPSPMLLGNTDATIHCLEVDAHSSFLGVGSGSDVRVAKEVIDGEHRVDFPFCAYIN